MKSVAAAIATKLSQRTELTRDKGVYTPLSDAGSIDRSGRPTVSFDVLVPDIFKGSTLGKDDNSVDQAGNGVKCNEPPEEGLPLLALKATCALSISH